MFNAWWVARGEVRKLEGLGRESLSSKHCGIEEVIWFSDIWAVNLILGWK